jgi:hypothetical protein
MVEVRVLVRLPRARYSHRMLDHLNDNNRAWAQRKTSADPGLFKQLEERDGL